MIVETYLSLKYLFSKRKEKFISLIAFLSIGGVAVSVMSLIVVIAVMTGFGESLKEKIIGMNPHLIVSSFDVVENSRELSRKLAGIKGVKEAYPFVEGQAMMHFDNKVYGVHVKGVETLNKDNAIFKKYLKHGTVSIKPGEIMIGKELASTMNAGIGSTLMIMSPALSQEGSGFPQFISFTVKGIFKSEMYEYDISWVIVTLQDAQKLYGFLSEQAHGIGVEIEDVEKAHEYKSRLADMIPKTLWVKSWMDVNKNLFAALKTEKNVMFILLTLAVLVAATNIVNTLVMIVLEKTREIGILKSIGMSDFAIMKVFVIEGAFIGFTGELIGFIGGVLFVRWLGKIESFVSRITGLEVFPREVYYFDSIPARMEPSDIAVILVSALVVSLLAALYPSWKASKLSPVEAIRYE
jgi:lipoprotein-releasing system permease protein